MSGSSSTIRMRVAMSPRHSTVSLRGLLRSGSGVQKATNRRRRPPRQVLHRRVEPGDGPAARTAHADVPPAMAIGRQQCKAELVGNVCLSNDTPDLVLDAGGVLFLQTSDQKVDVHVD